MSAMPSHPLNPSRQRPKRDSVLLSARLWHASGLEVVRLSDISEEGCGAYCVTPLPIGSDVELLRGEMSISARIAWARAGRVGLSFADRVNVADLRTGKPSAPMGWR